MKTAALTWMRCMAVHLLRQLLLGRPLAGVHGRRHIHTQGICTDKFWRQLPILQCMLHAHEAVRLGCGQGCHIRQLKWHRTLSRVDHMPQRNCRLFPR